MDPRLAKFGHTWLEGQFFGELHQDTLQGNAYTTPYAIKKSSLVVFAWMDAFMTVTGHTQFIMQIIACHLLQYSTKNRMPRAYLIH